MTELKWQWEKASRSYGNYGNANQWTVNAGMDSLARESTQNTNDARTGDSGDLTFSFIRLGSEQRRDFEASLMWPELERHLAAMASSANAAVTAGQIKDGLRAIDGSDELVLLQIADYGCRGLTGPEYNDGPEEAYGNFVKLCRLDLFSGKDEAAGGSFGLGKAVYWRFSRLQTVLFNSTIGDADAVDGRTNNRLFGVNAGVIHEHDGHRFQGRGYFGVGDGDDVASAWGEDELVEKLHLKRDDTRPGTTALLLGFYDPDEPDRGTSSASALIESANKLRAGVENNFWPLISRGRLNVSIRVIDDGKVVHDERVDPGETYTELVQALAKFDSGEVSDELSTAGQIVVRDIPISIPARREEGRTHEAFKHTAKLVVTLSDTQDDSLENRVCLLRKSEMVVETIDKEFEGTRYHAFLLAGGSIRPKSPSPQDLLADDFLRFAEPPAHDRWIPGTSRNKASQSNLTARYLAPWVPNLNGIRTKVLDGLYELFGTPPPSNGRGPEAVLNNLSFLKAEPGTGGVSATPPPRKPRVDLVDWRVEDGRWDVTFEITARNRKEGWRLEPELRFVGLDGRGQRVDWASLQAVGGSAELDGHQRVTLLGRERGRKVSATFRGMSVADLPIPAEEAAIDVVLHGIEELTAPAIVEDSAP